MKKVDPNIPLHLITGICMLLAWPVGVIYLPSLLPSYFFMGGRLGRLLYLTIVLTILDFMSCIPLLILSLIESRCPECRKWTNGIFQYKKDIDEYRYEDYWKCQYCGAMWMTEGDDFPT